MSWGRGVNNNTAGSLRMPSVAQFEEQFHQKLDLSSSTSSTTLTVLIENSFDGSFAHIADSDENNNDSINEMLHRDGRAYVYTHDHPHFLLRVSQSKNVAKGSIVLSEVQAANFHVCTKEPYEWHVFREWSSLPALNDIVLEVRHRFPTTSHVTLDSAQINAACAKVLFGLIVTMNELFLVRFQGIELVCRVIEVTPEEEDIEAEGADLTFPDHYRGIVEAGTIIYMQVDEVSSTTLFLEGAVTKETAPPPKDMVNVTTLEDDELFPVKTKLLRPCLALTSAVQSGRGVHANAVKDVSIATDCCTFDRVLLFLEALAKGNSFDILPEHLEGMSMAADVLKLQSLKDLCDKKRGAFESRVRKDPITFEEIVARNTRGQDMGENETLLIMSGMVFDVTRWLPEHPGGSFIIPEQALNMDSTVFFEIYHVSRQSFLYLKEFYIGELRESDLPLVPKGQGEPSPGFLEQLHAHTPWRLDLSKIESSVHKSF